MGIVEGLNSLIQNIDKLSQEGNLGFSSEEKSLLSVLGQGLNESINLVQPVPVSDESKIITMGKEGKNSGEKISETIEKASGLGLYVSALV